MRPTTDEVLMDAAKLWEAKSTCDRNHVGAIIAMNGRQIGSGYNGAPAGMPHCIHEISPSAPFAVRRVTPPGVQLLSEAPYDRGCKEAIHAEANALAYAARCGTAVEGGTIFTTLSPCYSCSQLIIAAGLVRVVFNRSYRDPAGTDLLQRAGLTVDHLVR